MKIFRLFVTGILFLSYFLTAQNSWNYDPEVEKARDLFNQGLLYFSKRSYEAAIDKFQRSLSVRSRDQMVRYYLGLAYYQAGYSQNALTEWENIIRLGGQDSFLAQKLSAIYLARGQKDTVPLFQDYIHLKSVPNFVKTNVNFKAYPTGLLVDKQDQIYLLDHDSGSLIWIHPNGDALKNIFDNTLSKVTGGQKLTKPYELFSQDENSFLISDFGADRVIAMDKNGNFQFGFGGKGVSNGVFLGPSGLAVSSAKQIFVADTGNCRIQVFNEKGEFLFNFGKRGSSDGELMLPSGLAIDNLHQKLYVADRGNNRIAIFDWYGNFVGSFGESFLLKPRKILTDLLGKKILVLVDSQNVYLYDMEKDQYHSLFYAVNDEQARNVEPLSAAFDRSGLLYIGDAKHGQVEIFSPMKLLYVNLTLQTETIDLSEFPYVSVTASVKTRDGIPVNGLTKANFELRENNLPKTFDLTKVSEKYQHLNLTLLVEKTRASEERKDILKAILEDLFSTFQNEDQAQVVSLGGGSDDGGGTFREVMPMNNSVLKNIDETLKARSFDKMNLGSGLKRAIGDNLNNYYQKGILLIVFSDISTKNLLPESFETLADYASRNHIPISVLYAGPKLNPKKLPSGLEEAPLNLYTRLTKQTGGQLLYYQNKATLETLLAQFRNFQNGVYRLKYSSFGNTLKAGLFRNVEVKVTYKAMTGIDNRGGYPIPAN